MDVTNTKTETISPSESNPNTLDIRSVECPKCHAHIGENCKLAESQWVSYFHVDRITTAIDAAQTLQKVEQPSNKKAEPDVEPLPNQEQDSNMHGDTSHDLPNDEGPNVTQGTF